MTETIVFVGGTYRDPALVQKLSNKLPEDAQNMSIQQLIEKLSNESEHPLKVKWGKTVVIENPVTTLKLVMKAEKGLNPAGLEEMLKPALKKGLETVHFIISESFEPASQKRRICDRLNGYMGLKTTIAFISPNLGDDELHQQKQSPQNKKNTTPMKENTTNRKRRPHKTGL